MHTTFSFRRVCAIRTAMLLAGVAAAVATGPARAGIIHDEGQHGDLSGNGLNPTHHTLNFGANTILATSVAGDREYVRLTVPAGGQLDALLLQDYISVDGTAFIAVQSGITFTEPPVGANPANMLGWTHFGPGVGQQPGDDILPAVGQGALAIGFTPPLPAGEYTWWMQQTGPNPTTYQFDFVVSPEPGSLALLGAAGLMLIRRRK